MAGMVNFPDPQISGITVTDDVRRQMQRAVADIPGVEPPYDPATRFDKTPDPAKSLGRTGFPPNMGEFALPHITTFMGAIGSAARVYYPSDEALRHSLENARFMRNDPVVMEPLELRQKAVALLDWHLEPEDQKSSAQIQLCEELTKIIKKTPWFLQYRENLLHATFYGRYGVENRWRWKRIDGKMRVAVDKWLPVHGDKLVFRYDFGDYHHDPDQLGIRVGSHAHAQKFMERWGADHAAKIEGTNQGRAYFLDSWERPLLSVHRYQVEDGEYEDPASAGRIHGHGIRSRIYWVWYQKQEALAYLMEYLERSAGGVEIWYYPMGNKPAEAATRKAAQERISLGRNVITVPRPVGEDAAYYDVQRIEPGMQGVSELKEVINNYFGHQIKRYILGQTLTTEADATGLGSSLADVHLETFMLLIRYDAALLDESITQELLGPLKRWNFPHASDIDIRYVTDVDTPDAEKKLQAYQIAYQLGLPLRGEDIRDLIGAVKPTPEDEIVSMEEMQKTMMEMQAQMQQQQQPDPSMMGGAAPPPGTQTAQVSPDEGDPMAQQAQYDSGSTDRVRMHGTSGPRPEEPVQYQRRGPRILGPRPGKSFAINRLMS